MYQIEDLALDFTTQIKRSDEHISQLLKDLSRKSKFVVTNDPLIELQTGQRMTSGRKRIKKEVKRGSVVRTGDIICFGRVPIMIKEWSHDQDRYEDMLKEQG